jgi:hypothetical protein
VAFAIGVALLAAGFVLGLGVASVAEHGGSWLFGAALAVNAVGVGVLLAALWNGT